MERQLIGSVVKFFIFYIFLFCNGNGTRMHLMPNRVNHCCICLKWWLTLSVICQSCDGNLKPWMAVNCSYVNIPNKPHMTFVCWTPLLFLSWKKKKKWNHENVLEFSSLVWGNPEALSTLLLLLCWLWRPAAVGESKVHEVLGVHQEKKKKLRFSFGFLFFDVLS